MPASAIQKQRGQFEVSKRIYDSAKIVFKGVDGWDVYNCSVPFLYKGQKHMYGRVERRDEWANSHVRLFVESATDEFTVLPNLFWELEDPYIQNVNGEMIFGGTRVRKNAGKVTSYYGFFFRGTPYNLTYFTTGPDFMKDIRIVGLADGRVGVFSRWRNDDQAVIGFTIIADIDELTTEVIAKAEPLDILEERTWGGVNQAYLLTSGKVGCIGHYSYKDDGSTGEVLAVYVNIAFVLDPITREIYDLTIIGSKTCYPASSCKVPNLADCVFASGIVMLDEATCNLYSGVGDIYEGRITIDYPFKPHGDIITDLSF